MKPAHASTPPRVVLLTSGGIHGAVVLASLQSMPEIQVAGVLLSSRVHRASQGTLAGGWSLIRQCGWRYASYLLACTRLADVMLTLTSSASVAARARREGISLLRSRKVNDPVVQRWLGELEPDLILCAFFNQRVADSTCATARLGAVNIHPGPLPAFKGVDPVFYAALRGSPEVGVTLHRITHDFDSGPTLASHTMPMNARLSIMAMTSALYRQGAALFRKSLPDIVAGVPGTPQTESGAYDSWPSKAQVRAVHATGHPLVAVSDLAAIARGKPPGGEPS